MSVTNPKGTAMNLTIYGAGGVSDKTCRHGHVGQYAWEGKRYRCIPCRRASNRKNLTRIYATRPEYKKYLQAKTSEHRRANPLKTSARSRLQQAVQDGRLSRPANCDKCSEPVKPEGHHFDYTRAFSVLWLCKSCHEWLHHTKVGEVHV